MLCIYPTSPTTVCWLFCVCRYFVDLYDFHFFFFLKSLIATCFQEFFFFFLFVLIYFKSPAHIFVVSSFILLSYMENSKLGLFNAIFIDPCAQQIMQNAQTHMISPVIICIFMYMKEHHFAD